MTYTDEGQNVQRPEPSAAHPYTDEDFERDVARAEAFSACDCIKCQAIRRIIADRNRWRELARHRHVCGLQGFGALGDVCPECERDALKAENELLRTANIALESEKSMLVLQLAGSEMPTVTTYSSTSSDVDSTLYVHAECPDCKRLKAEVERLTAEIQRRDEANSNLVVEVERLTAEVAAAEKVCEAAKDEHRYPDEYLIEKNRCAVCDALAEWEATR